jgi:hypothetical protein
MRTDCSHEEKALPGEMEGPESRPIYEPDQNPLELAPEEEAVFRRMAELDAIPLEDFATVHRSGALWDLLPPTP